MLCSFTLLNSRKQRIEPPTFRMFGSGQKTRWPTSVFEHTKLESEEVDGGLCFYNAWVTKFRSAMRLAGGLFFCFVFLLERLGSKTRRGKKIQCFVFEKSIPLSVVFVFLQSVSTAAIAGKSSCQWRIAVGCFYNKSFESSMCHVVISVFPPVCFSRAYVRPLTC